MTVCKRLFPLVFLLLTVCGEVDERGNKSLGDSDSNKGLTRFQKQRTIDIMGSLGDLQHVVYKIAQNDFNIPNQEEPTHLGVNRAPQRRLLLRHFDLPRCVVRDQGDLGASTFRLRLSGNRCPVQLDYFENRGEPTTSQTETGTIETQAMTFGHLYDVRNPSVTSDIRFMEMEGSFRKTNEKEEGVERLQDEMDIVVSGRSRQAGTFEYTLEQRWTNTKKEQGSQQRILTRADRLRVGTDFRVTLYRVDRYVNDLFVGQFFRLNAVDISKEDYVELMQDLHNQWGVEIFDTF